MRRLPFDIERCHGANCAIREQCARYTNRDNVGPRSPYQPGSSDGREVLLAGECERFLSGEVK
jgi:hypothetical protein